MIAQRLRKWLFRLACLPILLLLCLLAFLVACLLAGLLAHPAQAQELSQSEQVCIVLLLDNSGSMASNDPQNLRFAAARLLVLLLDPGDQAGVIVFATSPHLTSSGLETLGGGTDDPARGVLLSQLTPLPAAGYTDIRAAFELAAQELRCPDSEHYRRVVVLLTDGLPHPPQAESGYTESAIAAAQSLKAPVLSIALTPQADTPFLSRLALETGGSVVPAADANALAGAYLQALAQVKDRLLLTADPSGALIIDPGLAPLIQRLTFVHTVQSGSGELLAPDSRSLEMETSGGWQTYSLSQPAAGVWRISSRENPSLWALARLRLRLQPSLPAPLAPIGQPLLLCAELLEQAPSGKMLRVVGQTSFSALVTAPEGSVRRLDRFYDDGAHGDETAGDGLFCRWFNEVQQPGRYKVAFQAWKGPASLQVETSFQALVLPNLVVDAPAGPASLRMGLIGGQNNLLLAAHLEASQPDEVQLSEAFVEIQLPGGKTEILPLEIGPQAQALQGHFPASIEGAYTALFTARGSYQGLPFHLQSPVAFQVHIQPVISFNQQALELGRVDARQLAEGINFTVPVTASISQPLQLWAQLEGLPGLSLMKSGPYGILPGVNQPLALGLASLPGLVYGDLQGRLKFSASQGVLLENAALPIHLESYQPTINFAQPQIVLQTGCPAWQAQVTVPVHSTSSTSETLALALFDPSGSNRYTLAPGAVKVPAGASHLSVILFPTQSGASRQASLQLQIIPTPGIAVLPAEGLPFTVQPPPLWQRCGKQAALGGGAVLGGLGALGLLLSRSRKASRAPLLSGTLRYWPPGKPGEAQEIDLTAARLAQVFIGTADDCILKLPDPQVLPRHALLRPHSSARDDHPGAAPHWMVEPIGPLKQGYRVLQSETPIFHGDKIEIGAYQIQFLSDKGE